MAKQSKSKRLKLHRPTPDRSQAPPEHGPVSIVWRLEKCGVNRIVPVESIIIGKRKREAQDIQQLADDIRAAGGLLQPIGIREDYRLVFGARRLAACKLLGMKEVPCRVMSLTDLEAELAEIDENLCRQELTALERSEHFQRRKEIYEAKNPETKAGVAGGKARQGSATDKMSFADATAAQFGLDPRTIRRDTFIARHLTDEAKAKVRATPIANNQNELIKFANMERAKQKEIAAELRPDDTRVSDAARRVDNRQTRQQKAKAGLWPGAKGIHEQMDTIHEAGHAVTAYALGCIITKVAIGDDQDDPHTNGYVEHDEPSLAAETGLEYQGATENAILIAYAGQEAVAHHMEGRDVAKSGTGRDRYQAGKDAASLTTQWLAGDEGNEDAIGSGKVCWSDATRDLFHRWLRSLVRDFLTSWRVWTAVEKLAKELLIKKKLTGEQVEKLIGKDGIKWLDRVPGQKWPR
jgi:ParB family chromosome partitioning protein